MEDQVFAFDPLVVGAMRLGEWGAKMKTKQYEAFINACLELGLQDFDHADIYGHYTTEQEFGEALKSNKSLRDQIRLITKCGIKMQAPNRPDHLIKSYDLGGEHIVSSVEQSLKNFNTDRIDVLLLHRPDVLMDPFEIARTFEDLRASGKVLYFGVSNFTYHQFHALNEIYPLVTNQIEASVSHLDAFDDGTLTQCMQYSIQPMAWSPLGGGTIFSDDNDGELKTILKNLSEQYDCSLDQLMLTFLLKHPSQIVPVLGTSKIDRVKAAVESTKMDLTREDWYRIWQAAKGHEVA
ncbi:MAG: putative oxidoreductase [Cyclobacteriaceae bacterium]|jgi:predicted oxidoreductase